MVKAVEKFGSSKIFKLNQVRSSGSSHLRIQSGHHNGGRLLAANVLGANDLRASELATSKLITSILITSILIASKLIASILTVSKLIARKLTANKLARSELAALHLKASGHIQRTRCGRAISELFSRIWLVSRVTALLGLQVVQQAFSSQASAL